ncbi:lysophospholipid acyltransferase family protein [Marinobacter caseinilyticus]|uniref:lysophospholipid acyltransferase family protein n=1 Tax=Marinobacter caseinilyticus TaxID=2692195 RepID=UPI00140B24D1|nr:1-acylglycerol-3-phosphate O-acyltransferase [Marinobacter caseinilyticus]
MGMLRAILAWLLVPVLCMLGLVVCLARPFNPANNRLLGRMMAKTGRFVLGLQRPLIGAQYLPEHRPTVLIANHQHNDDLFVLGDLLPPRTVTVGKSALAWVPFFGQAFWLGGNVMINRSRSKQAVCVMQATSAAITRENKSLWVFPEGTRSRGRGLQAFKKGAFYAAVASGAPITIVCASAYHPETTGLLGRRRPVTVEILPPVETAGLTNSDIPDLMQRCHEKMQQTIDRLSVRTV